MSPTRRDILRSAGALAALVGTSQVSSVAATNAVVPGASGGLTSIISVHEDYPRQLGTMVGIVLAAYREWTIDERTHFLIEFERTFPAMSGSIVEWIQRKGDES